LQSASCAIRSTAGEADSEGTSSFLAHHILRRGPLTLSRVTTLSAQPTEHLGSAATASSGKATTFERGHARPTAPAQEQVGGHCRPWFKRCRESFFRALVRSVAAPLRGAPDARPRLLIRGGRFDAGGRLSAVSQRYAASRAGSARASSGQTCRLWLRSWASFRHGMFNAGKVDRQTRRVNAPAYRTVTGIRPVGCATCVVTARRPWCLHRSGSRDRRHAHWSYGSNRTSSLGAMRGSW
jgi:hypothetical protein